MFLSLFKEQKMLFFKKELGEIPVFFIVFFIYLKQEQMVTRKTIFK